VKLVLTLSSNFLDLTSLTDLYRAAMMTLYLTKFTNVYLPTCAQSYISYFVCLYISSTLLACILQPLHVYMFQVLPLFVEQTLPLSWNSSCLYRAAYRYLYSVQLVCLDPANPSTMVSYGVNRLKGQSYMAFALGCVCTYNVVYCT
jgi:hypothetical protein